jgi:site-specific DNA recombinase
VKRFAAYLRISTVDKQDPALSFPSQRAACERKAAELGGSVVCQFEDQQSGTSDNRPGWGSLAYEAGREDRRFDAVLINDTSRLARDVYLAMGYERALRDLGIEVRYASGDIDASSPDGRVMLTIRQAMDEAAVATIRTKTHAGMAQAIKQGWRMGGRCAYGYQAVRTPTGENHRGEAKDRVTLEPNPAEAEAVRSIFHMHGVLGLSPKAIANALNQPDGPPPPTHVDPARNERRKWAQSTIASMLRNPVYTGSLVWNRWDFAKGRRNTTGKKVTRLRPEEEWVIKPGAHDSIVSDEEFARSQERFRGRRQKQASDTTGAGRQYALAGMVHCCAGHAPRSMQGKARVKSGKVYRYMACSYRDEYGEHAASPGSTSTKTGCWRSRSTSSRRGCSDRCACRSSTSSCAKPAATRPQTGRPRRPLYARRSPRPTERSRCR